MIQLQYFICLFLVVRPFIWYQALSRSNIKVTNFKEMPLLGHSCFTNTSCLFGTPADVVMFAFVQCE